MIRTQIGRLAVALLLFGSAGAPAQDRTIAPIPSLAPLVDQVAPAVVNISVTQTRRDEGGERRFRDLLPGLPELPEIPDMPRLGAGSGVIVDAERGYVLTNHHVVANASDILVTLNDNRSYDAEVIGSDEDSDIAVLRIDNGNLTEIAIAPSNELLIGDYVVAIGNPFGFGHSVTSGIVSGLGRIVARRDNNAYQDFIQTDASINPGNSGGALVNLRGELVGINSAIISQTGGNVGIGFAIPTNMAVSVMQQLIEFGEVHRGQLGVNIGNVTPQLAEECGLPVTSGARILDVWPDSAAEAAGIRIRDVIVRIGNEPISDSNNLRNVVGLVQPGQSIDIGIVRGSERMTMTARLDPRDLTLVDDERRDLIDELFDGAEIIPIQLRGSNRIGLSIDSIESRGELAAQGLRNGDVITLINGARFRNPQEANAVIAAACSYELQVRRDGQTEIIRLR